MIPDKKSTDFNTNGASSIDIIFKHFYSSDDDVTVDQCLAEWNLLKYNLIKMKEDLPSELDLKCTSTELCLRKIVSQKHEFKYMCPILTNIAEIVLTVPVSNAWPERGEDNQNRPQKPF
jgi:hypothetical protein